jgi:tetratricopeptide (TPR) repeat protein
MSAHGNMAIALGSIGRSDEARTHASTAISIAKEMSTGWRHADAYDVLAIVEIASDRPLPALQAIDEALSVLGELEQPMLRYQLAEHRTWALAMLGRAQAAKQWLAKADKLRSELAVVDAIDEQDLVATRARTLEASEQHKEAIEAANPNADRLPDAFVSGSLNLVLGRCCLALADEGGARVAVERAALSGDKHGWVFPDRGASAALWSLALKSGDSRVVRYAEKMIGLGAPNSSPNMTAAGRSRNSVPPGSMAEGNGRPSWTGEAPPPSFRGGSWPGEVELSDAQIDAPPSEGETLIYVTTPQGVTRIPLADVARHTQGSSLVVDTLTHALRVEGREVSLERRRALEPLVVQLLRRAKEGLSAEEILRAAGGPGPESADAEHRVRVLISRVRDLLGDPASIERVRDAGEYGRTRYRLAPNVNFALVEPLFSSNG